MYQQFNHFLQLYFPQFSKSIPNRFQPPSACTSMTAKERPQSMYSKFLMNMHKRQSKSAQRSPNQPKLHKCGGNRFLAVDSGRGVNQCVDYQQLKMQEPFRHIERGRLPQTLTVLVEGHSQSEFRPGDDITVSGCLGYRYKRLARQLQVQSQLILLANSVTIQRTNGRQNTPQQGLDQSQIYADLPLNLYESYNLTSREKAIIKQLEWRNDLISHFCPQIYGRNHVKLGLLLGLLGGVAITNQNTKVRGNSHVLLLGEPGTGKSVLIKELAKLADRSFFTNGIGTSAAGLSVSYHKDGPDWVIEAGALVLADNGICCIDELTLMAKKEENCLLEAMEQQTVSSAKASITGKLNARTTIIAACNPVTLNQKYNPDVDLQSNTGLSAPLLSRFDLVLILVDKPDRLEDSLKCDHLFEKILGETQIKEEPFPLKNILRKAKTYSPTFTNSDLLAAYYGGERKNPNKITTARALESLFRISEAHAKLMMRDETNQLDCATAVALSEGTIFSTIQQYYLFLDKFNAKYQTNFE